VPLAPGLIDIVNAPTLIGARGIASHPPAEPTERLNRWYVHYRRDKTFGVAAPSSTTCDKNVLKRISTISAELQHAAVKPESRIRIGCFKIEVVPESQTRGTALEETKLRRIESLVAYYSRIIAEGCIRR